MKFRPFDGRKSLSQALYDSDEQPAAFSRDAALEIAMLKSMKTTIAGVSAAAMLATSTLVAVPAAQAEAGYYGDAQIVPAGYKGNNWKYKKYGGKRHYKRYHDDDFDFPSGLFFGLAAGALLGSAIAQPRYYGTNWDAYCSRKFKTYKPWTGTYRGYDGYEHPCP
jgi:hypothetical protein